MFPIPSTHEVGLAWLERMRWGAVGSAFVVLLVARVALGIDLPLSLLGLLTFSAATNVAFSLHMRRGEAHAFLPAAVLAFDVVMLTIALRLSGGASNPFSALYLVYVTLGAVLVGPRATWTLVLVSIAGFAVLFVGLDPADHAGHGMHQMPDGTWMSNSAMGGGTSGPLDPFLSHLYGMLAAYAVSASLIAFFVTRLSAALSTREAELARARERSTRVERLASLTTLAAGAAHELGTPLGTIVIAAKELERALRERDQAGLAEDAALVREEARRCREILDGMAARAGETVGESPSAIDVADVARDVVTSARATLGEGRPELVLDASPSVLVAPARALASVVTNLLTNAIDAARSRVTVRVARRDDEVHLTVEDDGEGMDEATLVRAVEPFFTTKGEGRGMGLGLFLVTTIVERLGGRLELRSIAGSGTSATIHLRAEPPR